MMIFYFCVLYMLFFSLVSNNRELITMSEDMLSYSQDINWNMFDMHGQGTFFQFFHFILCLNKFISRSAHNCAQVQHDNCFMPLLVWKM